MPEKPGVCQRTADTPHRYALMTPRVASHTLRLVDPFSRLERSDCEDERSAVDSRVGRLGEGGDSVRGHENPFGSDAKLRE